MFTADRAAGGVLVLLALGVLIETRVLPLGTIHNPGPAYMPTVLALLLLVFGVLLIARRWSDAPAAGAGWSDWRHAVAIPGRVCLRSAGARAPRLSSHDPGGAGLPAGRGGAQGVAGDVVVRAGPGLRLLLPEGVRRVGRIEQKK